MSTQGVIAGLCGLAIVAACRHRPPPEPTAQLARDSSCAQTDSGVDVGQDVRRGPRYRVDSSGQVETLPPVPVAETDTAKRGCPAVPDTSGRDSTAQSTP
ncbi:MAG TPA: hypothetical protein VJQ46_07490 [Gemmatimonadales bacterium]|nr:hypothetical protein [Gemmatimonadales bacterium]